MRLDGVEDANVQFAASKVIVTGETTVQALEKAGSFENLKIVPENQAFEENTDSFWKKHSSVLLALMFLLVAGLVHGYTGEESLLTIGLYLTSILVGGMSFL